MVELKGDWKKLRQRLLNIIFGANQAVTIIREEVHTMNKEQSAAAPVDTGFLRDNHESRDLSDGAESESKAPYSGFVEYGTSRMGAQPFFRPSMTHRWMVIQQRTKTAMKK